jgi:hypothetical protein
MWTILSLVSLEYRDSELEPMMKGMQIVDIRHFTSIKKDDIPVIVHWAISSLEHILSMRKLTEGINSDIAKESVRKMKDQINYVKSKRGTICCKIETQCSQALSDQLVQVAKGGSVWLTFVYILYCLRLLSFTSVQR